MGENKHIEELDAFAKKYIKEIEVEEPSVNFTDNIMATLKQENSSVFKVAPLISTKGWLAIAASIIALLFIPFKSSRREKPFLTDVDFPLTESIEMPNLLEGFQLTTSSTTTYAVVFFALMILVQVFMLKNHFDKKLES